MIDQCSNLQVSKKQAAMIEMSWLASPQTALYNANSGSRETAVPHQQQ